MAAQQLSTGSLQSCTHKLYDQLLGLGYHIVLLHVQHSLLL